LFDYASRRRFILAGVAFPWVLGTCRRESVLPLFQADPGFVLPSFVFALSILCRLITLPAGASLGCILSKPFLSSFLPFQAVSLCLPSVLLFYFLAISSDVKSCRYHHLALWFTSSFSSFRTVFLWIAFPVDLDVNYNSKGSVPDSN